MDKHTETFHNYLLHLEYMDFISIAKLLKVRFLEEEATEALIKEARQNEGHIDSLKDKVKFRRDFEVMIGEVCEAFSKKNREERRRLLTLIRKAAVHTDKISEQVTKQHGASIKQLNKLDESLNKISEVVKKTEKPNPDSFIQPVDADSDLARLARIIQDGVDTGLLKTTLKDGHRHITE